MTDNSCSKCRYSVSPGARRGFTGIKCVLTGRQATGPCEEFMQGVGQEPRIIAVSPEAEDAFVALASALGYRVRKVNP